MLQVNALGYEEITKLLGALGDRDELGDRDLCIPYVDDLFEGSYIEDEENNETYGFGKDYLESLDKKN